MEIIKRYPKALASLSASCTMELLNRTIQIIATGVFYN